MNDPPQCAICKDTADGGEEPANVLTEKGSASINRASTLRKDNIHTSSGELVHKVCGEKYTDPREIAKLTKEISDEQVKKVKKVCLRSDDKQKFSFERDCLFCGRLAHIGTKRKSSEWTVFPVRTIEFKETLLKSCNDRADDWAGVVKDRVLQVHDLHAADAVYHQVCSVNFRTNKQIPTYHHSSEAEVKKPKLGRPQDEERINAFLEAANYLEENDDEQITISDLISRMEVNLKGSQFLAYGYTHMKFKLKEHFGERIIETEINGKPNVLTFRSTAKEILQDFYAQRKVDVESEKKRIIETAAKLIKDDIKSLAISYDVYPNSDSLKSEEEGNKFLPESLKVLLKVLFVGRNVDIKTAAIGQAIMQATRPEVILAPMQVGLAVQVHHHFASRFLVDTLHRLGFCCSYKEVQRFVRNAAVSRGTDIPGFSGQFLQYAADNVDHNIRTLDGHNTFHGMGIIAAVTPATDTSTPINRTKVTCNDVAMMGRVPIMFHREETTGTDTVKFQKLISITAHDPTADMDIIWKTAILFASPRPAWSGMMQFVHHGNHPGKSSTFFLPMIDMNSSDATCIFSTLKFISEHACRHNATPIITFDQPLWWKAMMIVDAEPHESDLKNIILRLGGFHTEMSFLGSIGHLMSGSGLQEVLELVYAANAVVHMMTGKAVARALRAHLLVDGVLNGLILCDALELPQQCVNSTVEDSLTFNEPQVSSVEDTPVRDSTGNPDLDEVAALYTHVMEGSISAEEACHTDVVFRVKELLKSKKEFLKSSSRTAALWIQYLDMMDIVRKFIRAERTGNWALHLESLSEMLPFMAAAGHNLYTKSVQLYVQRMLKLKMEHPQIYQRFEEGYHVVRRSDRLWAGLSVDLIIEQVLMRSMKTGGGLTRGRGMTEQQRVTWLLAMPACAEVNNAMQEVTGVNFATGEQNKDMTDVRQARDVKDTQTFLDYLKDRNPFCSNLNLRSISTGIHAHITVNVDIAKTIGSNILASMDGQSIAKYKFKKKDKVITMSKQSLVQIGGEAVQVDPILLFQRLLVAAKASQDMASAFKYELCSHPAALFDTSLLLRQPQKPVLADAIWALTTHNLAGITGQVQYVLDGGALVQRIPWSRGMAYRELCLQYTEYVTRKYGKAIVVFDGYEGTSTKDMTHKRRTGGRTGATVTFDEHMILTMKKEEFLANNNNKQNFINMLSDHLQKKNCETFHSQGDADLLIVQKAVESCKSRNTVLVGDDTDLLILLIYHANIESNDLFFKPEAKKSTKNPRVWNIKTVKQSLGPSMSLHILFIHAILGCDTTSRLYGIGKGVALNKFTTSDDFQKQALVFHTPLASATDVVAARENALVCLYNGNVGEGLDALRYKRFCEKVATGTSHVLPMSLPPTTAAAKYHSLRVYYQVQQWRGTAGELLTTEWGWKDSDGGLIPVQTDLPPAPQELLQIIRCSCKTDCSSLRCTCKKHDIECSVACKNCKGSACMNSSQVEWDDDENELEVE